MTRGGCSHESMSHRSRFYALLSASVSRLLARLVVRRSLFLAWLRGLVIRSDPAAQSVALLRKKSSTSGRAASYLKVVFDHVLPVEVI